MQHLRHRNRQSKRARTFTGCWTCRSRKLKCDEQQPNCGQCLSKRLECEGYLARLHWQAPETGDPTSASLEKGEAVALRSGAPVRRQVVAGEIARLSFET